jgi:uncharacterized repeat protein (TIGR03806 family)
MHHRLAKGLVAVAVTSVCALAMLAVLDHSLPARAEGIGPVEPHLDGPIPRQISAYNLFLDPATQTPNEGVVPYDLISPLFSDYSEKYRFIWLPPGTSAQYHETEAFDFPVGTIIVKTFSFLHDIRDPSQGERLIETRLLIRKENEWAGLPYRWNEDATEATLALAGGRAEVSWTHYDGEERRVNYIIPNFNQCIACHRIGDEMQPIGPKARHLNHDFDYLHGTENQIAYWTAVGYLEGAPAAEAAPRAAQWDDPHSGSLDARARAYLDINCMHCHNPRGPANTSGLDLSFDQDNPALLGVWKTPIAAGRGSGGFRYDIVPGKPEESILLFRMESTEPGVMMPELPRLMIHDEGVALIREWIANMEDPRQAAR